MEKCRFPLTPSSLSRDNDASGEDDNLVPGLLIIPNPCPSQVFSMSPFMPCSG